MAKKITGVPNKAVKSLGAPTRESGGSHKMKATWKVPSNLVSDDNARRATKLKITWSLGIKGTDPKSVEVKTNEKAKSDKINLNNFKAGKTTYDRSSFYPCTNTKLSYVTVKVKPGNPIGYAGKSHTASATRKFKKPPKPWISVPEFAGSDTGILSATITTGAGEGYDERYDTWYSIRVKDTLQGIDKVVSSGASWKTEFGVSYNASNYMQLSYTDYIRVTFSSCSRGYAGNSDPSNTRIYYISYPAQPIITDIQVDEASAVGKCTVLIDTQSTTEHPVDRVRLQYIANCSYANANQIPGDEWTTSDIVDDASCTAMAISAAELMPDPGKHTWVRIKSYHADENVLYRYSAPKEVDALFKPALTAEDDDIFILEAVPAGSSDSALVTLGWNADGLDDSTGTELTWSDEEDTWRSTESPSLYTFTWSDGGENNPLYWLTKDTTVVEGKDYYSYNSQTGVYTKVVNPSGNPQAQGYFEKYIDHATIVIKGLDDSKKYYIKARRYKEGDTTTYSAYSNTEAVITGQKPEAVVATCDRYVAVGDSLTIRWTFSGYTQQTGWQVVQSEWYELTTDTEVNPDSVYYEYDSTTQAYNAVTPQGDEDPSQEGWYVRMGGKIIEEGTGSLGSIQISSEKLRSAAHNGVVRFRVYIFTGDKPVISDEYVVSITDPPTLSLDVPSVMTANNSANPFTFTATASTPCDLITKITSQGITGQYPEGMRTQVSGDTVYSDLLSPEWGLYELTEDQEIATDKTYYTRSGSGTTEDPYVYEPVDDPQQASLSTYYEFISSDSVQIQLPPGLDFWDLGEYTVSVTAVDRSSGLRSEMEEASFSVDWTRKAPDPEQAVTLTVIDETTETGDHRQAVQIKLMPPAESCVLTSDTEVVEGKGYYTISGSGTEEDPYITVAVEPQTGDNPASEGWYESNLDVYDIYRIDVEKPTIIGQSFPLDHTTVDEFAPFSSDVPLFYRVAIRTVDGDVEFADIEYTANNENIRFDWTGGYIELPYGITFGDSYKKDIEIRNHMNGETDAYWNQNVERKSSLSSDVIRIIQPNDIAKVRSLARYTGAVFVRKPDGSAFQADVQVTDLSRKNEAVMHVAFDATEIGLTQDYALPIPFGKEVEQ